MAMVIPTEGEVKLLNMIFNNESASFKIRLFMNDYTPIEGSVAADFTEADGAGYVEKVLTRAATLWTVPAPVEPAATIATYTVQQDFVFTGENTGGANVFGYYIVHDDVTDVVLIAERFTSSIPVSTSGGTISLTPAVTLD